jgi:predicted transcriptional regulator
MTTIRTAFRGESSHTLILLKLLADGKPWTPPQLADASGLTLLQVYNSMRNLRKGAFMRSLAQPYQITPSGRACLVERLGRSADLAERAEKRAQRAAAAAAFEAPVQHLQVTAPSIDDEVASHALMHRTSIESAWSALS